MELGLKNKTAFIGGSSQGLGKSVALELAREGANVIICGRNAETLNAAKKEIEQAANAEVLAVTGDLSVAADREKIIAAALKKYKSVDILITNTGGPPAGKFEEIKQEEWEKTFRLLLESTVGLIHGFLPGMKKSGWGRIIAITSQAVKQPVNNLILSNSVRASVAGLVKSLSNELGAYNITVNNVMPGYTQTARLEQLLKNDAAVTAVTDQIPLKRIGKPEEFAAAVTFLASERAGYITGISLAVDGGWIKSIL